MTAASARQSSEKDKAMATKHPQGCSCGSPDCPQYQADLLGIAYRGEDHATTDAAAAYWLNGSAYCAECVECDTPCLGESEIERSLRQPGEGVCGCCKLMFVSEAVK